MLSYFVHANLNLMITILKFETGKNFELTKYLLIPLKVKNDVLIAC